MSVPQSERSTTRIGGWLELASLTSGLFLVWLAYRQWTPEISEAPSTMAIMWFALGLLLALWGVKDVAIQMFERARIFLRRAGTVILGISIVLWFLAAYPKSPDGSTPTEQLAHSFAGRAGHVLEPVIKPLGFDWQIGIGLISSFAAREVFVSTMGVVFNAQSDDDQDTAPLRSAMLKARWPDGRPLFTPLVCFTLMIFYVFAMQCMSTIAIVKRETNGWKWPIFQTAYMTGTAWILSLIVFQAGTALGF